MDCLMAQGKDSLALESFAMSICADPFNSQYFEKYQQLYARLALPQDPGRTIKPQLVNDFITTVMRDSREINLWRQMAILLSDVNLPESGLLFLDMILELEPTEIWALKEILQILNKINTLQHAIVEVFLKLVQVSVRDGNEGYRGRLLDKGLGYNVLSKHLPSITGALCRLFKFGQLADLLEETCRLCPDYSFSR